MYVFGSARLFYRESVFWSNFKFWFVQQNFQLQGKDPNILLKYVYVFLNTNYDASHIQSVVFIKKHLTIVL
jgi:hypothetical protein